MIVAACAPGLLSQPLGLLRGPFPVSESPFSAPRMPREVWSDEAMQTFLRLLDAEFEDVKSTRESVSMNIDSL